MRVPSLAKRRVRKGAHGCGCHRRIYFPILNTETRDTETRRNTRIQIRLLLFCMLSGSPWFTILALSVLLLVIPSRSPRRQVPARELGERLLWSHEQRSAAGCGVEHDGGVAEI